MEDSNLTTQLRLREFRMNHLYKIQDKHGKKVTFKPNFAQKLLINKYKEIVDHNASSPFHVKKNWICILKARQLGISTFKLVEGLDTVLWYPNKTVNIVAHRKDKMQDLFQKIKFAFDNLPPAIDTPDWRWFKPKPKYDNVNQLKIKHAEGDSTIKITLDARSWTSTNLHISELAFIKNAEDMMAGTEPTVENWVVTIETTANWFNYFYDFWNVNDKNDKTDYVTFFIPWYMDPNYRKRINNVNHLPECPRALWHVEKMFKEWMFDMHQWNWYLHKFTTSPDPDLFLQEFPTVPEDAFLSSGKPVFDVQKVKELEVYDVNEKDDKDFCIADERFPWLYYFDWMKGGENLLMWMDVAEGVKWWDYTTVVVCKRNYEVVAVYRWHIDPESAPLIIDRLYDKGYKARKAIGIERNNHWLTTLTSCKQYTWYEDVYVERVEDKRSRTITDKPWFHTNVKTKELIINFLRTLIRDELVNVNDKRIKNELFTYFYDDKGISNAIKPNHDDLVIALAICLHMRSQLPPKERTMASLWMARQWRRKSKWFIKINW